MIYHLAESFFCFNLRVFFKVQFCGLNNQGSDNSNREHPILEEKQKN